jgi:metallo-beta-lactamase class B
MPRLPLLLLALWLAPALAQLSPESAAKNQPVPPFRIAGDLYYVGASDVASYLVVTPAGMILLDGGYAETAPQIERNIATLGFKLTDVKILLNGHAHPDHAGGLAQLKRDSGAAFYAMDKEVQPLEHEGQGTFYRGDRKLYESIQVDRVLHDGDSVSLGGVALTAHRTAGHTPGCTSWSLRVMDGDTPRDALILCQLSLPGNPTLVGDPNYPEIPADFEKSFALLKTLPCEVFLSEHGSVFDLQGKRMRLREGTDPFVDPEGCKRYLAEAEQAFRTELAAEQKSATGKPSLP